MSMQVRISKRCWPYCQRTPLHLRRMARKANSISFSVSCSLPFPKAMIWFEGVPIPMTITINSIALNVVEKFCYRESNVIASGSLVSELDPCIGKAASTFGKLHSRVWANQHLSIHDSLCGLRAQHSARRCGTWPTYWQQEKRHNAFHFRCLRSILGFSWHDLMTHTAILQKKIHSIRCLSVEYIDLVPVAMCAQWKIVGFRSTSSLGNYPLLPDLSIVSNSATRTY